MVEVSNSESSKMSVKLRERSLWLLVKRIRKIEKKGLERRSTSEDKGLLRI